MTMVRLEGAAARIVDESLSLALSMIGAFGEHPQVQQLGTVLAGFVILATMGRALGIGR
jgi:hypothetical protein